MQLSFWIQDWFGLVRNNYDKVGQFAQGFIPALVARDFLIRLFKLSPMRLVASLCVCICFAVSAAYELVEWCAALWLVRGPTNFSVRKGIHGIRSAICFIRELVQLLRC